MSANLTDADFLLLVEATAGDYDRVARITGRTRQSLLTRSRHPRLRASVGDIWDRLLAAGVEPGERNWGKNRLPSAGPTPEDLAAAKKYSGHGRDESDANPSVPLARITGIVQETSLREVHRLLDLVTEKNLADVYHLLGEEAAKLRGRSEAIEAAAKEGLSGMGNPRRTATNLP